MLLAFVLVLLALAPPPAAPNVCVPGFEGALVNSTAALCSACAEDGHNGTSTGGVVESYLACEAQCAAATCLGLSSGCEPQVNGSRLEFRCKCLAAPTGVLLSPITCLPVGNSSNSNSSSSSARCVDFLARPAGFYAGAGLALLSGALLLARHWLTVAPPPSLPPLVGFFPPALGEPLVVLLLVYGFGCGVLFRLLSIGSGGESILSAVEEATSILVLLGLAMLAGLVLLSLLLALASAHTRLGNILGLCTTGYHAALFFFQVVSHCRSWPSAVQFVLPAVEALLLVLYFGYRLVLVLRRAPVPSWSATVAVQDRLLRVAYTRRQLAPAAQRGGTASTSTSAGRQLARDLAAALRHRQPGDALPSQPISIVLLGTLWASLHLLVAVAAFAVPAIHDIYADSTTTSSSSSSAGGLTPSADESSRDVQSIVPVVFDVSVAVVLVLDMLACWFMLVNHHNKRARLRRGALARETLQEDGHLQLGFALAYPGVQIIFLVVGFVGQLVLVTLVGLFLALVIDDPDFRSAVGSGLRQSNYLSTIWVAIGYKFLSRHAINKLFAPGPAESHLLPTRWPLWYAVAWCLLLPSMVIVGLLSYLFKLIEVVVLLLAFFWRCDQTLFAIPSMDLGYLSYTSLLAFEHAAHNPLALAFIDATWVPGHEENAACGARSAGGKVPDDDDDDADDIGSAAEFGLACMVPLLSRVAAARPSRDPRSLRRHRLRLRWALAYTLVRNPQLQHARR